MKRYLVALFIVLQGVIPGAAHAQWTVVAPVTDALNAVLEQAKDISDWAKSTWKEVKDDFVWAQDLYNQTESLMNDVTKIQNQYVHLEHLYNSAIDLKVTDLASLMKAINKFEGNIDNIFASTEGLIESAASLDDKFNAILPRVEGMAELDADHWHDFFAATEQEKNYSYKKAILQQHQIRMEWEGVKSEIDNLNQLNTSAEANQSMVKLAKVGNQALTDQLVALHQLRMQLSDMGASAALAGIAADNQKNMIQTSTAAVMHYTPVTVDSTGAGTLLLQ